MHTIHNIFFDVTTDQHDENVVWEAFFLEFFKTNLLPNIERICDAWDSGHPNTKCSIASIEIDIDMETLDLQELRQKVIENIKEQLPENKDASKFSSSQKANITIASVTAPFEALVHYLQEGLLPKEISITNFKEWLQQIVDFTNEEKETLQMLFSENIQSLKRMLSLLQNDYGKMLSIIQKTTARNTSYLQIEKEFFTKFLQKICTDFSLPYDVQQAENWYKTLHFSSAVTQFSKTFFQLLQPKVTAAQKKLTSINTTQLELILLQAMTQYQKQLPLKFDTQKIATVANIASAEIDKNDLKSSLKTENKQQHRNSQNETNTSNIGNRHKNQNIPSETNKNASNDKQHHKTSKSETEKIIEATKSQTNAVTKDASIKQTITDASISKIDNKSNNDKNTSNQKTNNKVSENQENTEQNTHSASKNKKSATEETPENTKETARESSQKNTRETVSKSSQTNDSSIVNDNAEITHSAKAKTAQNHKATEKTTARQRHSSNDIHEKFRRHQNTFVNLESLTTEKAGLILLHPFIKPFLAQAKLLDADNKITNIHKAATLLHYLATATQEVSDVELSLEKTVLGIPQETVIHYDKPLTEEEIAGCEELLKAVVGHWKVLKNSSPNTLRDMFLKRNGTLTFNEETITLTIERFAQDLLLDKLPWSISMFKLKWMEKRMQIIW